MDAQANTEKAVRILFPGLTHAGKMYDYGEIETNPTQFLTEAARSKLTLYHRDSKKEVRIARFIKPDEGKFTGKEAYVDEQLTEKDLPEVVLIDLDVLDLKKPELAALASKMGIQPKTAKEFDKEQLGKLITFMRKL